MDRPKNGKFSVEVNIQGVPKNNPTCFCQNFVKSPPNFLAHK